jgi:hypothetical protein
MAALIGNKVVKGKPKRPDERPSNPSSTLEKARQTVESID